MASDSIVISGRVVAGLGEGRYFMGQKEYRKQFIKKLGIGPYRGTLNIKLSGKNAGRMMLIKKRKGITIKGFRRGKKRFGDVACYNAETSGVKCALIMPKLSRHADVAEVIAQKNLRRLLGLKERSLVRVAVHC